MYTGNLTATLAVKQVQWPFTDLRGLADSKDYKLLLSNSSYLYDVLKVGIALQIWSIVYLLQ